MIGISRQNSINKLDRDNSSKQKLIEIDTAIRCKFEGFFIFDDRDKIFFQIAFIQI